ncbi:MAG: efflux RND transporter permease subunit [Desulfovibrionaceae bacterium]|nr:efflux RND transporter permease subunit [Desulfovibrionaceae bacterium]
MAFTFSAFFIVRPVATTLLTIALTLAGLVAFGLLPVAPLPAIDFPVVMVRASQPGASPETMAATVATPLERAMGRISGINEMTSKSSLGQTNVILQFDLERDADGAARDVQSAINAARSTLPSLPSNPTYRKFNPAGAPIMILSLASSQYTRAQLYDFASTVLAQKISQIQGVGEVTIGGGAMPAVRVELNPDALNRANVSTEDVRKALVAANAFVPKGVLENKRNFWMIEANDQLDEASDYAKIIIKENEGHIIKLNDVATIENSTQNVRNMALANGQPAVLLLVFLASGGNIIETVDRVKSLLPSLEEWLPKSVALELRTDRSTTIRSSLHEVEKSLIISVILVVLVTFLFLQSVRATIIPAVAAPVSLIATFAVMYLLGFSLDNLSLMALTVSTGFVVDDAIVVLENCMRHREMGAAPIKAAKQGTAEVGFTVISISLSLVAVFLPILFLGGYLGRLFREFAVVLTCAVLFSMVISLVTTPMMCARFLGQKDLKTKKQPSVLMRLWVRFLRILQIKYTESLTHVLNHPKLTLLVFFLVIVGNVYLFIIIPKGFFPTQDTGVIMGGLRTDQSASFQNMSEKLTRLEQVIRSDPAVAQVSLHFSGNRGGGGIFISLKPLAERKVGVMEVIGRLRGKVSQEPGVQIFMMPAQDIMMGGRSARSQYQYTLQSDSLADLKFWGQRLKMALETSDIVQDVDSDLEDHALETELWIDRDRLSALGLTMRDVDAALGNAFGQKQISTIYRDMNQYKVVLEFAPRWLEDPASLNKVYLPGPHGMVPLLGVARVQPSYSPLSVAHQSQFAAVTLSFNLKPNRTLAEAKETIDDLRVTLGVPSTIIGSFQGTAKMFADSLNSQIILILSAILFLYIVLGILYESLIHPLTILSTVPSAGIGALLALFVCGHQFSVIALIGLLLLAGIVKKNAIMMVDFALDAAKTKHYSSKRAIFEACKLRFRPIMMTTAAAVFGAIPLAMGQGDGAELRQPLGITIVGGLIVSQILTLYTTPVVYLWLDRFRKKKDLTAYFKLDVCGRLRQFLEHTMDLSINKLSFSRRKKWHTELHFCI